MSSSSESFVDLVPNRPHPYYFFADGNVTYIVENVLYKVHRYFFQRDSSVLRAKFNEIGEKMVPIVLHDIRSADLDSFLSILYPTNFGVQSARSVKEWTSILNLAVKWKFDSIQELAINHLSTLVSPVDKVFLGRKYNIEDWLYSGYHDLCVREEALTEEEGERFGVKEVIRISAAREAIRKGGDSMSLEQQQLVIKRIMDCKETLGDDLGEQLFERGVERSSLPDLVLRHHRHPSHASSGRRRYGEPRLLSHPPATENGLGNGPVEREINCHEPIVFKRKPVTAEQLKRYFPEASSVPSNLRRVLVGSGIE